MPTFATPLARNTIILGWISVWLAWLGLLLVLFNAFVLTRHVLFEHFLIAAGFIVGVALASQTTWAILDEGIGKHQEDMSSHAIAAVAKVCIVPLYHHLLITV